MLLENSKYQEHVIREFKVSRSCLLENSKYQDNDINKFKISG